MFKCIEFKIYWTELNLIRFQNHDIRICNYHVSDNGKYLVSLFNIYAFMLSVFIIYLILFCNICNCNCNYNIDYINFINNKDYYVQN